MAEQVVNSVTTAMVGELTSRVFSWLVQRYGKDAATSEKLQRLEMLLIKIHSCIEASEKRTIENSSLLLWRDKLKKAASQGDDVLAIFLQRAKDAQATSNVDANQQQGEATSSSAAAPATPVGVLSFTRNSLSGIVQGIGNARKMLFVSGDHDMERLNQILARLEKLSPDFGDFISLLQLHPPRTARPVRRRCSFRRISGFRLSTEVHGPTKRDFFGLLQLEEKMKAMSAQCIEEEKSERFLKSKCDSACPQEEQNEVLLHGRLEAAFSEICKAVELADRRNLKALEWLAYWGDILREAKEQDSAILSTISARKTVKAEDKEESVVSGNQERYELSSFVHRQEGLAGDVEYFKMLVLYMCPAC